MDKEQRVTLGLAGAIGGAMVLGALRAQQCEVEAEGEKASKVIKDLMEGQLLAEQTAFLSEVEAILEDGPEGINCEMVDDQSSPALLCEAEGDAETSFVVSFTEEEPSVE
ncbi:MAG: hypothetical protein AAB802_02230 [Patescibacteria group bacterium]